MKRQKHRNKLMDRSIYTYQKVVYVLKGSGQGTDSGTEMEVYMQQTRTKRSRD